MRRICFALFMFSTVAHATISETPCEATLDNAPTIEIYVSPAALEGVVTQFRLLAGRLYWSKGKIRKGYASAVEIGQYETNRQQLVMLGNQLRMFALLLPLTVEQREHIEMALTDYAQIESPTLK